MSRILLVYHNPLFAHSIRAVLRTEPQIALIGEMDDWQRAGEEITRLAPDVVLVEEGERDATDEMLRTLRAQPAPWCVVAMCLDETMIHIWSGAGQPLISPQDLIDVLSARSTPPHPKGAPSPVDGENSR